MDAALALRDARLDGHDTDILALQGQGPFASPTGGASNLINAQAWPGEITWNLLLGSSTLRNLHASAPLSLSLRQLHAVPEQRHLLTDALLAPKASESWVLATLGGYYTVAETNGAITAALSNYSTTVQMAAAIAAAETAANDYTDAALVPYSNTVQMDAAIAAALVLYSTKAQRENAVANALLAYYTSAETDAAIAAALGPSTSRATTPSHRPMRPSRRPWEPWTSPATTRVPRRTPPSRRPSSP